MPISGSKCLSPNKHLDWAEDPSQPSSLNTCQYSHIPTLPPQRRGAINLSATCRVPIPLLPPPNLPCFLEKRQLLLPASWPSTSRTDSDRHCQDTLAYS